MVVPAGPLRDRAPDDAIATPNREAVLRWLARAAALTLHADEVAVSSVLVDGTLRLVHCTGSRALEAEQCQAADGCGPAATALAHAATVSIPDLRLAHSCPRVVVRAMLGGMRSVTALPIGSHGRVNAVIDLWWVRRGGLEETQEANAEHLRHMADPVLELVEEADPAYRSPAFGRRRIGWAAWPT